MKMLLSLAVVAALGAAPAFAACTYPKSPDSIPDGSVSTLEQMLAGQRSVKGFDAAITEEQKKERASILTQKMNAAVDEAQGLADRLNAQIRVFKEKNAKK
jgi:hypothetical protein